MFPKFHEGINSIGIQSSILSSNLIFQSKLEGLTSHGIAVGIQIHQTFEIFQMFQGNFGAIISTYVRQLEFVRKWDVQDLYGERGLNRHCQVWEFASVQLLLDLF